MRIESGRSTGYSALFITGRVALLLAAAAGAAVNGYAAAPAWKPEKPVEFIVPDSPGGGQDRTVRFIQKFMQDGGVLTTPVNIVNRPGGSGNLAYTYLSQFTGDGHYLAIATATMLTNHILGLSPFSYADFTPAGVLYGEHIGFAVSAGGPIKSGRDLIERVRKNPESVSFAFGTSRGNANHIAVALVMKAAGVDVSKLKVVIYKASIDATTALMGGHVDVVATPASTFVPVIASGKVRVIAIAAPRRTTGQLASVPTWQEQGLNVVASGYRMFIAPKGLNAGQIAFWDNALARLSRSEAWKKELEANEWQDSYMNSADSRKYLDARYEEYRGILVELGLAKK